MAAFMLSYLGIGGVMEEQKGSCHSQSVRSLQSRLCHTLACETVRKHRIAFFEYAQLFSVSTKIFDASHAKAYE